MSFKEVIGQDTAIRILQNSLQEKRRGISYLFHGPGGVGKSFTAKQFAKSLNCQLGGIDSCDQCLPCLKTAKLGYPDGHWLDLREDAAGIGIGQIRQMRSAINLKPFEGRVKVFIINNAQALTEEAANCLLKVIEEPPMDSVVVLISSHLRAVLPTISSRCQKIKFFNLRRQLVREILERDYNLDSQQSNELAHYADGRLAQAISLSESDFLSAREAILDTFLHSQTPSGLGEFFKDKTHGLQTLSILMSYFRDVVFVRVGMPPEYLINQGHIHEIIRASRMYSPSKLVSMLNKLSKSFEYINQNINLGLLMDNIWTAHVAMSVNKLI